jgi:hypothetical protein
MARCYRLLVFLHHGLLIVWITFVPFFVTTNKVEAVGGNAPPKMCMNIGDSCSTVANCNPATTPPCICEKIGSTKACNQFP